MTHIKMSSFSPGTGTHFISNAVCSSDNCHTTFSLLHFSTVERLLQTHRRKTPKDLNMECEEFRELENTVLHHVPMGTVFWLDCAPFHSSPVMFMPFWRGIFWSIG
jgi:hypothetical protein